MRRGRRDLCPLRGKIPRHTGLILVLSQPVWYHTIGVKIHINAKCDGEELLSFFKGLKFPSVQSHRVDLDDCCITVMTKLLPCSRFYDIPFE